MVISVRWTVFTHSLVSPFGGLLYIRILGAIRSAPNGSHWYASQQPNDIPIKSQWVSVQNRRIETVSVWNSFFSYNFCTTRVSSMCVSHSPPHRTKLTIFRTQNNPSSAFCKNYQILSGWSDCFFFHVLSSTSLSIVEQESEWPRWPVPNEGLTIHYVQYTVRHFGDNSDPITQRAAQLVCKTIPCPKSSIILYHFFNISLSLLSLYRRTASSQIDC